MASVTLIDRFWSKVDIRGPNDCWLWRAGVSRSGRREVDYGIVREGKKGSRLWRAHRLALLLRTAPIDVPRDDDESVVDWLRRANRAYSHLDAAHQCDTSLCVNPDHVKWQTHAANVTEQRLRKTSQPRAVTASLVAALALLVLTCAGCASIALHRCRVVDVPMYWTDGTVSVWHVTTCRYGG